MLFRQYGHNIQAQPWLDDLKALEELAEKFSYMMKAVRENEAAYGARESEVKHLIKYTEDNEPVVIVTDDILKGVPESDWVKTVKDNLKKKFSKGIPFIGKLFKIILSF